MPRSRPAAGEASPPQCVLVSQVFPPAVGGSGVLLHNVYSRVVGAPVTVLVDEATCGRPVDRRLHVTPTRIDARSWGLLSPGAWPVHARLAGQVYGLTRFGRGIVHCGRAQPEGIAGLLASCLPGGAPYIFWAHGEDIAAALSSRQFAVTMRLVYRYAAAAIANSRNTAALLKQTGWFRGTVDVVYPGVDPIRFRSDAAPPGFRGRFGGPDSILLVSVARLQRRKGHDLVLNALPALLHRFPAVRYVIVGDGPERGALEALAERLGVRHVVHFVGEVSDADLPAYFSLADVFVLPTRVEPTDFEGFGIVFLEAAAAGKPVVAGRNGGVPEAVADGQTGILVEQDDLHALVTALSSLCESPALRARLGAAGHLRAVREFTWDRAAAEVMAIHRRVATARSSYPAASSR